MGAKKKVLITGAAGLVGGILRLHWGDRYQLRLADICAVEDLGAHEEFVETDIVDYEQVLAACQGMETVVHIAAYPGDGAEFYDTLLQLNVIGGYNAFQAAHQAGCQRMVFASSIDAVMGYSDQAGVEWNRPVYPTNMYGATKCWGEALGRVYADQHKLSCICVRLTNPSFRQDCDWDPDSLMSTISRRDCAQIFGRCVDVEDVDFAIVNGISGHRRPRLDLETSRKVVGYVPQDGTVFPKTRG